jgi:hypothetical protein
VTIDTHRQRKVVGVGIFAPRSRVIYTAGPRVDYRRIVEEHLTALVAGSVDDWGDPQVWFPGPPDSPTLNTESSSLLL